MGQMITVPRELLEQVLDFLTRLEADDDNRDFLSPWQCEVLDTCMTGCMAALKQPAAKPVAWAGYDLEGMVEAFNRVIESHAHRNHPFHNPIDADARMALRILRGIVPAMKRYAAPQPQPAVDEQLMRLLASAWFYGGWKAETKNERDMEALMIKAGWWPFKDESELLAKIASAPQPQQPQRLSDEEMRDALRSCPPDAVEALRVRWLYAKAFARAIEQAVWQKLGVKE